MPIPGTDNHGINVDGSFNQYYCRHCYNDGKFTSDGTMKHMIKMTVPHMRGMSKDAACIELTAVLPTLKRWKEQTV
jgi:hypothetical protein